MAKKSEPQMRQLTITSDNPAAFDVLAKSIQLAFDDMVNEGEPRAAECTQFRSADSALKVIVTAGRRLDDIVKICKATKCKVVANVDYHRTPMGAICKRLENTGWTFRGKMHYDIRKEEIRVYMRGGRIRILHHPTFKLFQLMEVNTDALKTQSASGDAPKNRSRSKASR